MVYSLLLSSRNKKLTQLAGGVRKLQLENNKSSFSLAIKLAVANVIFAMQKKTLNRNNLANTATAFGNLFSLRQTHVTHAVSNTTTLVSLHSK
jgi:hypothetical protein